MMTKRLILVDYENVQKVDLSRLDESYNAVIFVGANQSPPKAAKKKATAHRFTRTDFQKIDGTGKNALDFHIAFHLGRVFETAPDTECFVLSKDKGFDPLLAHLNKNGLKCHRVASVDEIVPERTEHAPTDEVVVCKRCKKASTIEHYGGRWCTNCGNFASPPDAKLLPSNQPGYRESTRPQRFGRSALNVPRDASSLPECGWCHRKSDMTGGIYDDGEWMCPNCIARYVQ